MNEWNQYFESYNENLGSQTDIGTQVQFSFNCGNFFKFKFIYFNWRLISLQYCIGFAIYQHESATGVHVSPS